MMKYIGHRSVAFSERAICAIFCMAMVLHILSHPVSFLLYTRHVHYIFTVAKLVLLNAVSSSQIAPINAMDHQQIHLYLHSCAFQHSHVIVTTAKQTTAQFKNFLLEKACTHKQIRAQTFIFRNCASLFIYR